MQTIVPRKQNIRALLTRNGIEWHDKGANSSSGFVNIKCPICGNSDPSFHLTINEEELWWKCFRNPSHKGKGIGYLFRIMGKSVGDFMETESYSRPKVVEPKFRDLSLEKQRTAIWNSFKPAETSIEALEYLVARKFQNPKLTAKQFNLKVANVGKWSSRLIIPLTEGWTARAMRERMSPRYLAEASDASFFVSGAAPTVLLWEGPMDAMKVASATTQWSSAAMCGFRISASLLNYFLEKGVTNVKFGPDSNAPVSLIQQQLNQLRTSLPFTKVDLLHIPKEFKDCGEMTESEVRLWLYSLS